MPPPFGGPGPGLFGALVTGAVVGGAVAAATRPPPPRHRYHHRGPYRRVVVVHQVPRGMPPLGPNERLVLVTCPEGVGPGGMLEIEVEGQSFTVTVPQGIFPGQQFYARVQLRPPQPTQVTATRVTATPTTTGTTTAASPTVTATRVQQAPTPPAAVPVAQQVDQSSAEQATVAEAEFAPMPPASGAAMASAATSETSEANPFADDPPAPPAAAAAAGWAVAPFKAEYDNMFDQCAPTNGSLAPAQVKEALSTTGLPREILRQVWELSDIDKDGRLDRDEFAVSMYLCRQAQQGTALPAALPTDVVPPSKRPADPNPF